MRIALARAHEPTLAVVFGAIVHVTQVKRAALRVLTQAVAVPYWYPLVSGVVTVFMLHRFANADGGAHSVAAADLRRSLEFLRRRRFHLAGFHDLLADAKEAAGRRRPTVLFTVDDGYADFASIAAPIFAEFDCPVTVFISTGPVTDRTWFWWDRVEYVFGATRLFGATLELTTGFTSWRWADATERQRVAVDVVERLKSVPDDEKHAALARLALDLEVEVPATPPPRYAAMSWDDVRRCARGGATFGPHTVTHPILPQVDGETAHREISESWSRLKAECDATVPVFSYPNGAFGQRELEIVTGCGLAGAVTTRPYYSSSALLQTSSSPARFRMPRFQYPAGDPVEFISVVTGLDRVNAFLVEGRPGWRCVG
jgi:peptidoglycan/xylan/chitin deacetylase (PgdA/CDA1 family)